MKKILLLIIPIFFTIQKIEAQSFSWMNSAGGTFEDLSAKVVKGTKNFYLYGTFEGTLDINNTQSGDPIQLVNQSWGSDIFLISADSLGKVVWAKSFGSSGYDSIMGSIRFNKVDSTVMLISTHTSDLYYGSSPTDFIGLFNGAGQSVAFLKIKENGDVVKVKTSTEFGVGFQYLNDVQQNDSTFFLSGLFSGDLLFSKKTGVGDTTITGIPFGSGMQSCIVSLDKNFKFNFLTVTPQRVLKMELDSLGNIYGIGDNELNAFLIKYTKQGTLKYFKQLTNPPITFAKYSYLNIISNNNISFSSYSSDTTKFNGINLYTSPLSNWTTHSQNEYFSLRVDSLGNLVKIIPFQIGTPLLNQSSLNVNTLGETYFTIPFSGTVTINNTNYVSVGGTDVLLLSYDINGNTNWLQSFGSTGDDYCNSITFDNANNPILHGTFESSITVSQSGFKTASPLSINSNGGKDVFYAKINRTLVVPTSLSPNSSKSFIIKVFPNPASNKLYIKASETNDKYTLELFNVMGQLVLRNNLISSVSEIDISSFDSGIYTYKIYNNNTNECGKTLIQH